MSRVMLKINHLFCGYTGENILKDIHFEIHQGDVVSIIGPNGSGKTTLLKTISNVLKPAKGDVFIEGSPIGDVSRKDLARKMAVVAQGVEAVTITVEEFILLGRLPFFSRFQLFETENDLQLAEKYMALTDTLKLKNAYMNEISGGERQLASIARALVQEPSLLLLDEPTSHLDITHQKQILELIHQLNRDLGLTVLMVLHDLNLASEYSNRLILLDSNQKNVFKEGQPEEVLTQSAINKVYNTEVVVENNPISGKPYVFLTPDPIENN